MGKKVSGPEGGGKVGDNVDVTNPIETGAVGDSGAPDKGKDASATDGGGGKKTAEERIHQLTQEKEALKGERDTALTKSGELEGQVGALSEQVEGLTEKPKKEEDLLEGLELEEGDKAVAKALLPIIKKVAGNISQSAVSEALDPIYKERGREIWNKIDKDPRLNADQKKEVLGKIKTGYPPKDAISTVLYPTMEEEHQKKIVADKEKANLEIGGGGSPATTGKTPTKFPESFEKAWETASAEGS